jgi:hypothetical protein
MRCGNRNIGVWARRYEIAYRYHPTSPQGRPHQPCAKDGSRDPLVLRLCGR